MRLNSLTIRVVIDDARKIKVIGSNDFKIKENINSFLSFTGFILIILSFFIFKKGLNPGFNTIVPCLGIFLILKFNRPNFLIYKLLLHTSSICLFRMYSTSVLLVKGEF